MKKVILVIVFGSIASFFTLKCSDGENSSKNNQGDSLLVESNSILDSAIANIDTSATDTSDNMSKFQDLIKSTENSDKKVKEIKVMKKENTSLKKELIKTKEELNQVKKILDSTFNESKNKKGFLKTVIDNIKGEKDTLSE
jgi:cell shape-determining protein MreC